MGFSMISKMSRKYNQAFVNERRIFIRQQQELREMEPLQLLRGRGFNPQVEEEGELPPPQVREEDAPPPPMEEEAPPSPMQDEEDEEQREDDEDEEQRDHDEEQEDDAPPSPRFNQPEERRWRPPPRRGIYGIRGVPCYVYPLYNITPLRRFSIHVDIVYTSSEDEGNESWSDSDTDIL